MSSVPRPLRWFTPSRSEIQAVPEDVKDVIGFKLRRLQNGEHGADKDIKPFGEDDRIRHLVKLVAQGDDGNTYRTAVTVEFAEGIWVLDVFEKRSTSGTSTTKKDIDRIASRLAKLKVYRKTPAGEEMIKDMMAETARHEARRAVSRYTPKTKGR